MHLSVCVCVCVVAVAVMVVFPSSLTEEEEALQKKYAKLKKKVRDWKLAVTPPNISSL